MAGWELVSGFNFITTAAYLGIAYIIIRGLINSHEFAANKLAIATAAIFLTCAAHHFLHGLKLVTGESGMDLSMSREMMGGSLDVLVTLSTAVVGVIYLGMRRALGSLIKSPMMFDNLSQARYRQLVANLPHTAAFITDMDLRFVFAGGPGLIEAGYDPKQLEGKLLEDIVPADRFAELAPHYRAAIDGGSSDFIDDVAKTGRVYHNRSRPMLDEAGKVVGALMLAEDITAERQVRAELEEAKLFNDAVLAASPDITTITDLVSGEVSWSSRSVLKLLGWPDPSTAPENTVIRNLILAEDQEHLQQANIAVAALADGDTYTSRFRVRAAEGTRWLSRQSTPFGRDAKGAVLRYLSVVRDISDVVDVERRMEHAALHDPLTGLPNRALLVDRMGSALARAARLDTEVAVLFCDLDGFKRVNDTEGHPAGDAVLIEVANRLRQVLRESDSVARVGGDEFVVILEPFAPPGTGVADSATGQPDPTENGHSETDLRAVANLVADRIRRELNAPIRSLGREHVISVSIGMTFAPRGSRADDILREADTALYRAKQQGKNRVEIFDAAIGADISERMRVERVLRRALLPVQQRQPRPDELSRTDSNRRTPAPPVLSVAYQPVYSLDDRKLVGFEALARLTDSAGAPITPDSFIPVAEETGMIVELGQQVLEMSMERLARWRSAHPGHQAVTMAVNFSARQAQHSDMPQIVQKALDQHGLRPSDLVLELTESILVDSGTSTLRQLTELRDAGVGIAIDDFGTGYASLRYLATLPVSAVKVDRSFTASMAHNQASATIVRTIATLAADLGLECVVEGVETEDQLRALPPGVLGQGYLLGRPAADPHNWWSLALSSHGAAASV